MAIRVSWAFIYQTVSEVCYSVYSAFVKRSSVKSVVNLRKEYIFKSLLKVNYRSVFNESSKTFIFLACELQKGLLKVYTLSKILLWIKPSYFSLENACDSWCMHQTGLFSSAAVVPQSKCTELCSLAAVVPQSKSTKLCSLAAVVPQSKSTEM